MNYKIINLDSIPAELFEAGEKKYYRKNDILLDVGEIPQEILILLKGTVLTVKENSDGDIDILQIFKPLIPLFDQFLVSSNKSSVKFICYSDTEVIYISKSEFINLINNNTNITKFFSRLLTIKWPFYLISINLDF